MFTTMSMVKAKSDMEAGVDTNTEAEILMDVRLKDKHPVQEVSG